jgi:hypothetical protein
MTWCQQANVFFTSGGEHEADNEANEADKRSDGADTRAYEERKGEANEPDHPCFNPGILDTSHETHTKRQTFVPSSRLTMISKARYMLEQ